MRVIVLWFGMSCYVSLSLMLMGKYENVVVQYFKTSYEKFTFY